MQLDPTGALLDPLDLPHKIREVFNHRERHQPTEQSEDVSAVKDEERAEGGEGDRTMTRRISFEVGLAD